MLYMIEIHLNRKPKLFCNKKKPEKCNKISIKVKELSVWLFKVCKSCNSHRKLVEYIYIPGLKDQLNNEKPSI